MTPKPSFLFSPGGGIGDSIISLPILEFLIEHIAPYADIDCLIGFPRQTYKDMIGDKVLHIRRIFEKLLPPSSEKYQGSLTANELCQWQMSKSFFELMKKENPELIRLMEIGSERISVFGDWALNPPYHYHLVATRAVELGFNRCTLPYWTIGLDKALKPTLNPKSDMIIGGAKGYITINDGWAGDTGYRVTKAWSVSGWNELIRLCRECGIIVVQLGSLNNGQDYQVDMQLRGYISFSESLAVLKASSCHVDIEGGLTHAAAAVGTPAVVLFGPTPSDFFGYNQNINLTHDTCQGCWWSKSDWSDRCPKSNHLCMKHRPQDVFNAVKTILERKKHGNAEG